MGRYILTGNSTLYRLVVLLLVSKHFRSRPSQIHVMSKSSYEACLLGILVVRCSTEHALDLATLNYHDYLQACLIVGTGN